MEVKYVSLRVTGNTKITFRLLISIFYPIHVAVHKAVVHLFNFISFDFTFPLIESKGFEALQKGLEKEPAVSDP